LHVPAGRCILLSFGFLMLDPGEFAMNAMLNRLAAGGLALTILCVAAGAEELDGHLYGVAIVENSGLDGIADVTIAALERLTDLRFRTWYGSIEHGLDMSPWWARQFAKDTEPLRAAELDRLLKARPAFVVNFGTKLSDNVKQAIDAYVRRGGVFINDEIAINRRTRAMGNLPSHTANSPDKDDTLLWARAFEDLVREKCNRPRPRVAVSVPEQVPAGQEIPVVIESAGVTGTVQVTLEDRSGKVAASAKAAVKDGEKSAAELKPAATTTAGAYMTAGTVRARRPSSRQPSRCRRSRRTMHRVTC